MKQTSAWFVLIYALTANIGTALQNPYCSLPCSFGTEKIFIHTVCERDKDKCGPGPKCGPGFRQIEMTDELRQYALDIHNELRNKVASGNEVRSQQPSAKKMMILKYSKELEFIAQCWANTCNGKPLVHDVCRGSKTYEHVGQNLGFINSSKPIVNFKKPIKELINYWYDEVKTFDRNWVNYTANRGPNVKVGHYTQMLWGDTDAVGCAIATYTTKNLNTKVPKPHVEYHPIYGEVTIVHLPKNTNWHHLILVCNYSPGGNYIGEPLYDIGSPCTGCPDSMSCSQRYPALCGNDIPITKQYDFFTPYFRF